MITVMMTRQREVARHAAIAFILQVGSASWKNSVRKNTEISATDTVTTASSPSFCGGGDGKCVKKE